MLSSNRAIPTGQLAPAIGLVFGADRGRREHGQLRKYMVSIEFY